MDKDKNEPLLVIGLLGHTPAAIHATLFPYLKRFSSDYSEVHILLGATTGSQPSLPSFEKMSSFSTPPNCTFLTPSVSDSRDFSNCLTQLVTSSKKYKNVVMLCKGGMNRWIISLLLQLKDQHKALQLIQSDGTYSILCNSDNEEIDRKALRSLKIDDHLALVGATIEYDGEPDCTVFDAVIKRDEHSLPVLAATSLKNYLRVWIDARHWSDDPNRTLAYWRSSLDSLKELKINKEHVSIVLTRAQRTLKKRAREEGIFIEYDVPTLESITLEAKRGHNPKEFEGNTEVTNVIPESLPTSDKTLLVALSSIDSTATLTAITAHDASTVIVLYDENSDEIKVAANRLGTIARQATAGEPFFGKKLIFQPTTHIARLTADETSRLRNDTSSPLTINITPGTKEQSIALALCAQKTDKLYQLEAARNKPLQLTGVRGEPTLKPADYPTIQQIAHFCGGAVKATRRLTQQNVPSDALELAQSTFTHLNEIGWKTTLSDQIHKEFNTQIPIRAEANTFAIKDNQPRSLRKLYKKCSDVERPINANEWLELFVATQLLNAGAQEVLQGVEWKWLNTSLDSEYFKNEVDAVARFGNKIISVSCKTSAPTLKKDSIEHWTEHYREHSYVTKLNLGSFALPYIAFPIITPDDSTHQLPRNILWANDLISPATLLTKLNIY